MTDVLNRLIKNANSHEGQDLTPEKFVVRYRRLANGAVQMLDRLGLVQRDHGSILGWRATAQLEKIAAEAAAKPDRRLKRQHNDIDAFIFRLLDQTAGISRDDLEAQSAKLVLEELGLVRTNRDGAGVVTKKLMRLLLVDAYRIHGRTGQ